MCRAMRSPNAVAKRLGGMAVATTGGHDYYHCTNLRPARLLSPALGLRVPAPATSYDALRATSNRALRGGAALFGRHPGSPGRESARRAYTPRRAAPAARIEQRRNRRAVKE